MIFFQIIFSNFKPSQAQGVAYLHGTKEQPFYTNGGRYVFYPNGPGAPAQSLPPKRGQAIMMDGGRMIHGVERTHPGYVVGKLPKGLGYCFLIYHHTIRS